MMKYVMLMIGLVCLMPLQNARAMCPKMHTKISVKMKPGKPQYITNLSKEEFSRRSSDPVSPNTLGLTIAKLNITGHGVPQLQQQGRTACVGLKEVNLTIGYDTLDVYIDKKYRAGTCQYKVIKDHENYHVSVSQQAMRFFKKDVEEALRRAVDAVHPQEVHSQDMVDVVFRDAFQSVLTQMQPLIQHINTKIAEKNYAIDTPEAYQASTKLCPSW